MASSVWSRLNEAMDGASESQAYWQALARVRSMLYEADAEIQTLALTGDDTYRARFAETEAKLAKAFEQWAELPEDDLGLKKDLLELRGLAERKLMMLRQCADDRRTGKLTLNLTPVQAAESQLITDQIHGLMTRMTRQSGHLFGERTRALRARAAQAQMTMEIAGAGAFATGGVAIYLVWLAGRQKTRERELQEEKVRAEKALQEKTSFLANLSHEIRTPMNAILGFGELLAREPLSPRQSEYTRSLRQSGKALLQLINDVLDLSKLEAGMMEVSRQPTDLREIGAFLNTMFSQQAAQKSLALRCEVDPALPEALLLDRLRLRQVLVNLVSNAINFTARGHVTVRAKWEPLPGSRSVGTLLMEVEDTGVGIPKEKQHAVFRPFVQADARAGAGAGGTGLGLSIVKQLTEMTGGTVSLESTPGRGSVFRLRFTGVMVSARLAVSDHGDTTEFTNRVDLNSLAPATLLVADDHEANRQLIASMFSDSHHSLRFATNGREALQSISEKKPDLVLLDIRMPVMDGWKTLAEIRRHPEHELLVVIAVTTFSQEREETEARRRFNGFLRKPFSRLALYQELALFLPPAARPVGSTKAPPPAALAPAPDWPALTGDLRRLLATQWPALRDSLAVHETGAFAARLLALGQGAGCEQLITYATQLARYADTYAVGNLERHLAEFPRLVETISGITPIPSCANSRAQ